MSLVGAPRCSTHIVGKNNSSKLKITSNVVFTSFNAEKRFHLVGFQVHRLGLALGTGSRLVGHMLDLVSAKGKTKVS